MLDFSGVQALTFDCYGTLIDWETGLLTTLRRYAPEVPRERLLETYAQFEQEVEAGPYRPYREVLGEVLRNLSRSFGFVLGPSDQDALAEALRDWPPFPDTVDALKRLKRRFKLGIISNIDDELFAYSARRLEVPFDWIVTAQQAHAYKPASEPFRLAAATLGLPADQRVHVAQSLFHDHVPAKRLGLRTVWVNRRHDRPGFGATPPAEAVPDLEVPDLASLAELATAG